ncbi:MAG: ATP-binding protein [Acidobacteriota bacterium]|nr:ATP-binding protein [Acidobacteriota bacterium]
MTLDETSLEALLRDLESDRVERKRSARDTKDIRRAICALANDLPDHGSPGVIFVGVEDDGTCASLEITDGMLKKLTEMRSDGKIQPFPTLRVQKRTLAGCEVAVLEVEPSKVPPVRLDGRTFVRVGPTTRQASPEDERQLTERRRAGDLPFDLRPEPAATLENLDLEHFQQVYLPSAVAGEVLEQNQRTLEEQLASLRMTTPDGVPTHLGLLVLGRDPREFIPADYVQFLRIEGGDLTDPIKDQREIDGTLLDLLTKLDETLKVHISVSLDLLAGDTDVRKADYPIAALQQLVRNAVLHRNYEGTHAPVRITWFDDRIEIQNPGGPYGQVTRENFGQPGVTDYRNPHLAEAMKNLGFVQRFGVGIALARQQLEANGNPPLELQPTDQNVLAIVRRRS